MMVYLDKIIEQIKDEELKEALLERLHIVHHKIKFMDSVPLACIDDSNQPNFAIDDLLKNAGAIPQAPIEEAVYIIYMQKDADLSELMSKMPELLDLEWNAVKNNRILLIDQEAYNFNDPEKMVELVEDIAEMIHPGSFIFGKEGDSWMRFGV